MAKTPQLSKRAASNVTAVMPKIKAAAEARKKLRRQDPAAKDTSSSAAGDPTPPPPPAIDLATAENWLIRSEVLDICRSAIADELLPRHFSYPSGVNGDLDLVDALCGFFNAHFAPRIPVEPDHLAVAPGCTSSLEALLFNICDPGDGVLIPGPYWNGFDFFVFRARASVTPVIATTPDLRSSCTAAALLPALEAAFNSAPCPVKCLLLTNPSNPLGVAYPRAVLEACARFCHERGIHLVSDEIFGLTEYDAPDVAERVPFTSALSLDLPAIGCAGARVHVVWSTSKDFGQSGVRMGCTIAQHSPEVAIGVALAANTQVSGLTSVFVTSLLSSPALPSLIATNSARLSSAYQVLSSYFRSRDIPYIPCSNGLYIYAQLAVGATTWEEEAEVAGKLKEGGVLVSQGRAYHGPEGEKGWMRVGFAVETEMLEEALQRMDAVLAPQGSGREV